MEITQLGTQHRDSNWGWNCWDLEPCAWWDLELRQIMIMTTGKGAAKGAGSRAESRRRCGAGQKSATNKWVHATSLKWRQSGCRFSALGSPFSVLLLWLVVVADSRISLGCLRSVWRSRQADPGVQISFDSLVCCGSSRVHQNFCHLLHRATGTTPSFLKERVMAPNTQSSSVGKSYDTENVVVRCS